MSGLRVCGRNSRLLDKKRDLGRRRLLRLGYEVGDDCYSFSKEADREASRMVHVYIQNTISIIPNCKSQDIPLYSLVSHQARKFRSTLWLQRAGYFEFHQNSCLITVMDISRWRHHRCNIEITFFRSSSLIAVTKMSNDFTKRSQGLRILKGESFRYSRGISGLLKPLSEYMGLDLAMEPPYCTVSANGSTSTLVDLGPK